MDHFQCIHHQPNIYLQSGFQRDAQRYYRRHGGIDEVILLWSSEADIVQIHRGYWEDSKRKELMMF